MAGGTTNFPTTLDNLVEVTLNSVIGSTEINNLQAAIEAIEAKIGVDGSSNAISIDKKLATNYTDIQSLQGTAPIAGEKSALAGTAGTPSGTNKYVTNDDTRNTNARQCDGTFSNVSTARTNLAVYSSAQVDTALSAKEESIGAKGTAFNKDFGTIAGTVCQGNDSRLGARPLPLVTTITSSASITPNVDTTDMLVISALDTLTTFGAPTGTPVEGQKLIIKIKDNGLVRTLNWDSIYRAMGNVLPTITVASKTVYLGFIYHSSSAKWDLIALTQEA